MNTLVGDNLRKDQFGMDVHGVGDANGDGVVDFLVGALQWPDPPAAEGYARLFSGRTLNALYTFRGRQSLDGLGGTVRGVGDVNGDGLGDMLIAGTGDDTLASRGGSVRITSGAELYLSPTARILQPLDPLTLTLSEATPGSLTMLAVTSVNAVPFFQPLTFGFTSASEVWIQSFTVPSVAAGNTVGLKGFALDSSRGLLATTEELLTVQ